MWRLKEPSPSMEEGWVGVKSSSYAPASIDISASFARLRAFVGPVP
jgi:hypothetical protein